MPQTIGVERECFMTKDGYVVPHIGTLLPEVRRRAVKEGIATNDFAAELFAGQLEYRTGVCLTVEEALVHIEERERVAQDAAKRCGLSLLHEEFVHPSLVTNFEPGLFDARHVMIWNKLSPELRVAASVVAAVHVHVSATPEEAVRILNKCREDVVARLCRLGDRSDGMRLRAYRLVSGGDGVPPEFPNIAMLLQYITSKGGEKNVWDLVRYKPSTSTVEFRTFGATPRINQIEVYVRAALGVCCE